MLTPEEGLLLAASLPGVECLLVTADGRQLRSPGFAAYELPRAPVVLQDKGDKEDKKADSWPDGFQANITITLPSIKSMRYRRPYVAVWIENAEAKPVRTISVWGNDPRYFKDLPQWWKFARNDKDLVKAVTRATRSPGKYQLVWDGKDQKGDCAAAGNVYDFRRGPPRARQTRAPIGQTRLRPGPGQSHPRSQRGDRGHHHRVRQEEVAMLQQPNDADRGDAAPGSTGPDAAAGEPSKHLMGQPSDQVRAHPRRLLHHLYRHLVKSCRYLHVYLTLFGLALLLFFSVTGFMLNHEDWFLPPYTTQGKIPKELLDQAGEDRVPLIDKLKDDFAIQGEMVSFKAEEGVYHLGFEGSIQVVIQRDGETLVKREENRVTEHIVDGTLPPEMVKPWSDEKRFALVEKLRENFGVKGKAGDFKLDEDKLEVNFTRPATSPK